MCLDAAASDGAAVAIALQLYYRRCHREFRCLNNNSRIRMHTKRLVAYWVCQYFKHIPISIPPVIIGKAKKQYGLDIRKVTFSQRTVNE